MLFENKILKAREWYLKLKRNCKKCNGLGYKKTSGRTAIDCECTMFYDKYKDFIKHGMDINYIEGKIGNVKDLFDEDTNKRLEELKTLYFSEDLDKILFLSSTNRAFGSEFLANYIFEYIIKDEECILIDFNHLIQILCGFDDELKETNIIDYDGIIIVKNLPNYQDKMISNKQTYQHSKFMKFLNNRKYTNKTIITGDLTIEQIKQLYTVDVFDFLYDNYLHFEYKNNNLRNSEHKKLMDKNKNAAKLFKKRKIEKTKTKTSKTPFKNKGRKMI